MSIEEYNTWKELFIDYQQANAQYQLAVALEAKSKAKYYEIANKAQVYLYTYVQGLVE